MIYDHPRYYEAAFSFRDAVRESAFLKACIDRFSGVEVQRVLEIACGHAPHAETLASHGLGYIGLDNNSNMLAYAAEKLQHLQPPPEFIEGDMVSFDCHRDVEFAYVMLGSLYLNSLEEMTSHFDSVAACLKRGGLYFLDWCVQFTDPLRSCDGNEVVIESDGIRTRSRFDIRLIDSAAQMYEEVWTMKVDDHGLQKDFQTTETNRAIFPQEFRLFIKDRDDFDMVGWWCDWDLNRPVEGQSAVDRPFVLIKRI
ncbi:MAG: class I SAM-dependent methyltransferase [bacterium]|nr:class I SAM-dependent methyltransferase [bacterium]